MVSPRIDEQTLLRIEKRYARGISSAEILDVFASHGVPLSEATLRKYVQMGLLPRSVRVGKKGQHQGSKGIYPVRVVRQILRIKAMMSQSYTMDQIQREFLFMRSDLEVLEHTLDSVFDKLEKAVKAQRGEIAARLVASQVREAKMLSSDLLARLLTIESKLTSKTKLERAAAI